jgi:signal peptidase I
VLQFLKDIVPVLVCVLAVQSFVMAAFEVPTGSMKDTVQPGDRLLVNKFVYGGTTPYAIPMTSIRIPHLRAPGWRDVRRGDVIVFDWPGRRDDVEKPRQVFYLKRCIALPGDTVRIARRDVYVNGAKQALPLRGKYMRPDPLPEGYVNPDLFPPLADFNEDNYGPVTVPKKGTLINLSRDNLPAWAVFIRREGHAVSLDGDMVLVDGRPARRYKVEKDYVFAMGDNRDDSLDSRFWGFVPTEDVVGTPMFVFWAWAPDIPLTRPIDKLRSINFKRIGTVIR